MNECYGPGAVRFWTRSASEFRNGFEIGDALNPCEIPTDIVN